MDGMLHFENSLSDFLAALFRFLNDLLNGTFDWLADFFEGLTITF